MRLLPRRPRADRTAVADRAATAPRSGGATGTAPSAGRATGTAVLDRPGPARAVACAAVVLLSGALTRRAVTALCALALLAGG
ncbi:hypothetical protein HCN56_17170, partial [Streptomyces lonarensis]